MLAACLFAAPMAKAAQTYVCRIQEHGNSGWIPEILFLGVEDDNSSVVVSDPLILYFNDRAPVRGRVAMDNPRRKTFVWTIPARTRSGQYARHLQYTATYVKAAGRMLVSATPPGFGSHYSGEGTCQVEQR